MGDIENGLLFPLKNPLMSHPKHEKDGRKMSIRREKIIIACVYHSAIHFPWWWWWSSGMWSTLLDKKLLASSLNHIFTHRIKSARHGSFCHITQGQGHWYHEKWWNSSQFLAATRKIASGSSSICSSQSWIITNLFHKLQNQFLTFKTIFWVGFYFDFWNQKLGLFGVGSRRVNRKRLTMCLSRY